MLKRIIVVFFIFFIFSCSKSKKQVDQATLHHFDSISYFYNLSKVEKSSKEKRKFYLDKAFSEIKGLNNSFENRNKLAEIAFDYYNFEDFESFRRASDVLLKKSLPEKDSVNLGKAYRCKATYLKNNQVYDSSFFYFSKAEKIYKKKEDKLVLANVLLNKGIVQYLVSDFLGAELSLTNAYTIFKDSDKKDKLFGTLNQLGLVYNELKEYDKAIFFHTKALETVNEFNLKNKQHQDAVCYNNLGYLYIKQNNYKQAIINFELGLKDKRILKDDADLYALLVDNLAYSRLQTANFKDLPKLFFEALEIRERINDPTVIVGSYIHLSEYYQKKGDNLLSIKYSDKAIDIAKSSKIASNVVLALKQASLVDIKNASQYSKDYIRISDSLQLVERNSKDRFAKIQLETEEIIKEKDDLEEKNRNILNYFMGTIVIGGFMFFLRSQRAKNRELILRQAQQKANEDIYKLIISQQNKLDEGRVLEKTRIAKELHDGVLGRLFGLRLNLDGLNNKTDEESVEMRLQYLSELKNIEQDLREISHELSREKFVLINNFVAIVNNLLDEQTKVNKASLKTHIGEDIDWDLLSNTTKINLYRILQESLQNINKYANAENIKVEFKKDKKGNLILNIVDDGVGFDVDKKTRGIGIQNIISRTHESQGIIDIKSEKDKGTRITITVPLEGKTIKI